MGERDLLNEIDALRTLARAQAQELEQLREDYRECLHVNLVLKGSITARLRAMRPPAELTATQ